MTAMNIDPYVWTHPPNGAVCHIEKMTDEQLIQVLFWCEIYGPQKLRTLLLLVTGQLEGPLTDELIAQQPDSWPDIYENMKGLAIGRELKLMDPPPDEALEYLEDPEGVY